MQRRYLFVIALFIAALARILYSGERLLLWTMVFLAAISVLAAINLAYTLAYVRITQKMEPSELTGEEFGTLAISITNCGALPLAHLEVRHDTARSLFGTEPNARSVFSVMPGQTVGLRTPIFFPYRGVYSPGITQIVAYDLFGFFKITLKPERYALRQGVTVLPKRVPSAISLEGANPYSGGGRNGHDEQEPYSIAEIRAFRSGDPLKKVHWKLSARMGELLVKEYDGTVSPRIRVFVDFTAHGKRGASAFENCVCVHAAAICRDALGGISPVKLLAYTESRMELDGDSPPDIPRFMRFLAEAKFACRYRFIDVVRAELDASDDTGSVVVITGGATAELTTYLGRLTLRGLNVSLVAIAEDSSADAERYRSTLAVPAGVELAVAIPFTPVLPSPEDRETSHNPSEEPSHA
jgi:uncharacterized protein (DUF58 family)